MSTLCFQSAVPGTPDYKISAECLECGSVFDQPQLLKRHLKQQHSKSGKIAIVLTMSMEKLDISILQIVSIYHINYHINLSYQSVLMLICILFQHLNEQNLRRLEDSHHLIHVLVKCRWEIYLIWNFLHRHEPWSCVLSMHWSIHSTKDRNYIVLFGCLQ